MAVRKSPESVALLWKNCHSRINAGATPDAPGCGSCGTASGGDALLPHIFLKSVAVFLEPVLKKEE